MKTAHTHYISLNCSHPVHIGTDEAYNPTNFVIDDKKLYHFDEILFYKSLNELEKAKFNKVLGLNSWLAIIKFYKTKIDLAKEISDFSSEVSQAVEKKYKNTRNEDGTEQSNTFKIETTFKNPNTKKAIIPGSSIKGMFDTILNIFEPSKEEERKDLSLSDALIYQGATKIAYTYRRHKDKTKSAKSPIPQIKEYIEPDSKFLLVIKCKYDFKELKEKVENFYASREGYTKSPKQSSFIARLGKYSGQEYMLYDIKDTKNSYNKNIISTHTLNEEDKQFGWIELSQISKEDYEKNINAIYESEIQREKDITLKQKSIKDNIKKFDDEKKYQDNIKKEEDNIKKEEDKKEKELQILKKEQEEQRINNLSPFEKKLNDIFLLSPAEPKTTVLLNAIKQEKFSTEKKQALEYLKKLMQEEGKWKDSTNKKDPNKDKNFQRTKEIKKMLGEDNG